MKLLFILILYIYSSLVFPQQSLDLKERVVIPLVERPAKHRLYADKLLQLALELSKPHYGPYEILQQSIERVAGRQILELENGQDLSVAVSMPLSDWLEKSTLVPIPIMKGLASYRMFFTLQRNKAMIDKIQSIQDLKLYVIGQGRGWSTARILEQNHFKVMYATKYDSLFPMLEADRFQLLMRGIYEVGPELSALKPTIPDILIADNFAVYTYLPMYFFVTKQQPKLATRILHGLNEAFKTGKLDTLFNQYFIQQVTQLNNKNRKVFTLENTNIGPSYFKQDRPYLLDAITKLETQTANLK